MKAQIFLFMSLGGIGLLPKTCSSVSRLPENEIAYPPKADFRAGFGAVEALALGFARGAVRAGLRAALLAVLGFFAAANLRGPRARWYNNLEAIADHELAPLRARRGEAGAPGRGHARIAGPAEEARSGGPAEEARDDADDGLVDEAGAHERPVGPRAAL